MKFLLVTSQQRELVNVWVCQETSHAGSLLPPVDLASIAAVIGQKGHDARILDLRFPRSPFETYIEGIKEFGPDFIVLNLSTTSAKYDYELIAATPDDIKIICFGTHAQSLPEESFKNGVDYVLVGDPEAAISSLMENNMEGAPSEGVLTDGSLNKGPCYWQDLDTMPFPALDLLEMDRYHAPYIKRGNFFTLLLASRGCPYRCTYCLYPVQFGNAFRLRSVGNVVDEMEQNYKRHGIKEFYFLDATFNVNNKRVEEFCDELTARGLDVAWSCNMRVTPVSARILGLMKEAGCSRIFYGVEDQDYLDEVNKGISKEQTIEAFRLTKESGILTVAFTMLFPERDMAEGRYEQSILNTLAILEADAFQCNVAIPFPGTEMFEQLHGEEKLSGDWSLYDPYTNELPYESKLDLIKVRKGVYRRFFLTNPGAIMRVASDIDLRSLFNLAVTFVKKNLIPSRPSRIKKMGRD